MKTPTQEVDAARDAIALSNDEITLRTGNLVRLAEKLATDLEATTKICDELALLLSTVSIKTLREKQALNNYNALSRSKYKFATHS